MSAGKVHLIHMIGCTCAIEMGESSVPVYHVPVRSYRWFRHVGCARSEERRVGKECA